MRDVLRWQRELTETLSETNTHLEALNELRSVLNHDDEAEGERALDDLRASLESLESLVSSDVVPARRPPASSSS